MPWPGYCHCPRRSRRYRVKIANSHSLVISLFLSGFPMFDRSRTLDQVDADVWAAIQKENVRQEQHIELIASENYASPAVMQAQGTQLTNKYAEGYPGRRYYGGCGDVGIVGPLAVAPPKTPFVAEESQLD